MSVLIALRDYVRERRSTSLLDISNRLEIAPEALRGMLQHWINKGVIQRHDFGASCGGCNPSAACGTCSSSASFEIYDWVG